MMSDTSDNGQSIGDYTIHDENRPATQASANIRHARTEAPHRTSAAFWATLAALVVALAIVVDHDYSTFRKHNIQLAQLPGVVDSLTGVRGRLAEAEAKLGAWSTNQDALGARLSKLETRLTANLRGARKQTQGMIVKFQEEMQKELNQRTQAIDAHVSRVESGQDAERFQLTRLQEQMAEMRKEVASARQEIDGVRRDTSSEVATLLQQEAQGQTKLEAVTNKLARERVDFEVAKNETRELISGIDLHVLRTNVSYQRFAAYLDFVPDSRTLWIENQGVQQPVIFRSKQGGESYELVVTGVNTRGVVGYMLLPKTTATESGVMSTGTAASTMSAE